MKCFFCFFLVFIAFNAKCQELKKMIVKSESGLTRKEFTVLADSSDIKHGVYEYFFGDKLFIKGYYNNGLKEGLWLHFNNNNEVILRSYFKSGLKIGDWKYYFNKNQLASIVPYKDDVKHGKCLGYGKNGNLTFDANYKNGKIDGIKSSFFLNGNKKDMVNYIDGAVEGDFYKYFINGDIQQHIIYKNDKPFTVVKTYDNNKKEINGGDLFEGNGSILCYSFDTVIGNNVKLILINNYKNGVLNGKTECFHRNGKVKFEYNYEALDSINKMITYDEKGNQILEELTTPSKANKKIHNYVDSLLCKDIAACYFPEFPDGDKGLLNFIKNEVVYPLLAIRDNIQGLVHIGFYVDEFGSSNDHKITKSSGYEVLDYEALNSANAIPPCWKSGFSDGIPVKTYFTLPINFKIK